MGKLSKFIYDFFGLDSMEKIMVAAGIILTVLYIFIYIATYSEEKAWRKSIWGFLICLAIGFAFYNWKWWVAALVAVGEVLAAWGVASLLQEKKQLEKENFEKDFRLWQAEQMHQAAQPDKEEKTPPPVKTEEPVVKNDIPAPPAPEVKSVEQTLRLCMRCGRELSGTVCGSCGYDNRKKVRLLCRTDPRKLQIKE